MQMPNDILSDITFVGFHEVIEQLVKVNLRFSAFFPEVPELSALDEIFPSGYATMLERTHNSVTFRVESVSDPPLDALHALKDMFPGLYIRCLWKDEGGREGLWVTCQGEGEEEYGIREVRWFGPCLEAYVMDPITNTNTKPESSSNAAVSFNKNKTE